jgi:endonuclease/exonuclease/phosphatase family metal-dependent hydrolase
MSMRFAVVALGALVFVALSQCGQPPKVCVGCPSEAQCIDGLCYPVAEDGGVIITADAGTADAGTADAGHEDAGTEDAGDGDAGVADAGDVDAGAPDAGAPDAGAPDAGPSDAGMPDAGPTSDGGFARVRLMAANLTAGNNQNYNVPPGDVAPGPGPRIMLGARPDVVMLQEFTYGADNAAALQSFAELILGPGAYVCREVIDGAGYIPNGIISRYPILACGEWQDSRLVNRDYAYARIDVPGPKDLWAISVHLHTTFASREIEANEILAGIMSTIPAGDFVVLGGDFNTDTSDPTIEPIFNVLDDVFVVQPQPTDQFGNPGTNTNRLIRLADGGLDPQRNKPYDWVIGNAALDQHQVPVVLTNGSLTYTLPHGLIIDTRVFDAGTIGLIAPAQLGDSAALNMQHMGVVRDFDLPL